MPFLKVVYSYFIFLDPLSLSHLFDYLKVLQGAVATLLYAQGVVVQGQPFPYFLIFPFKLLGYCFEDEVKQNISQG